MNCVSRRCDPDRPVELRVRRDEVKLPTSQVDPRSTRRVRGTPQHATNKPGKNIKVGLAPGPIAITPNGKTAYVALGLRWVTPINTATNKPGRAIKDGNDPTAIAITPNGKTVYVTNCGNNCAGYAGTVTPINTSVGKAGKPIKVGQFPEAIAITPNGKTAYVSNNISGTVTPINTATNKALKAIKVPYAGAIVITP